MQQPTLGKTTANWTMERLRSWFTTFYQGETVIVLANREPFRHDFQPDGAIRESRSSGGLVTALEPLTEACAGMWVAQAAGTADHLVVDPQDRLDVPSSNPTYHLRRVWLSDREQRGYYYGFANEGLWPLCHRVHVQPIFRSEDFEIYRGVNARFAEAVSSEATSDSPLVFVQDYHFALAPELIRQRMPHSSIVTFWHIPWPHPLDFAIVPWARQLLAGLLGSTIIGFQTTEDCRNFIEAAASLADVRVNRARDVITHDGRSTIVRAYPVSIDWPNRWATQSPSVEECRRSICQRFNIPSGVQLGVGIDRLDYTKGITEKFLAIRQLLQSRPEFRGRFVFVQVAEPSRGNLPAYRDIRARVVEMAARINTRFGSAHYHPIVLVEERQEPADVYRLLRAADVCYVGSLHDGMNLVAKEFVGARDDCRGVLLLSQFAGAARELTQALIVNPYAIDASADALAQALCMPAEEQADRLSGMRRIVAEHNTYRWAGRMLVDVTRLRRPRDAGRQNRSREVVAACA